MTRSPRRQGRAALPLAALLVVAGLGACTEAPRDPARPSPAADPGAGTGEQDAPVTVTVDPVRPGADPTDDATGATRTEDGSAQPSPTAAEVTVLATGFEVPWGLVVLEDGTVLVGERDTAQVWRVPGGGDPALVGTVPGVVPDGEGGLLGLAVPPGGDGSTFWAYLTAAEDNRVVRVDAGGGPGELPSEVVLDGIPKAGNHNGGRIAFGPDGHLYVATGDASDTGLSQDPGSLAGKILRVTPEGDAAEGNPTPGSPVWSLGHRNVQGLAWDADERLWATEFGQDRLDEVNLIEPGGNYGWPHVEGTGGGGEFVDPLVTWATAEASPSGVAVGPDGALYVAALRGQSLWRVPLEGSSAAAPERLLEGEYGRLRSVVTGPDGAVYVLTSNTFRGNPAPEDDRLLRITAPERL